jgi:hypothetical protein
MQNPNRTSLFLAGLNVIQREIKEVGGTEERHEDFNKIPIIIKRP